MIGHKIKDQDAAYFKYFPSKLKEEYRRVMQYLTIEKVKYERIKTREFQEVIEKNKKLKNEISEIKEEKNRQIQDMERRMEHLEKLIVNKEF
jgi:hypothetical protein